MEAVLKKVYASKRIGTVLSVLTYMSVFASVISFSFVLGWEIYLREYKSAAIIFISALVGFFAVTLARILINAPRPYELYGFYEEKPKKKSGRSFPSRHAYSAFVIATLSISFSPFLSAGLFVFATSLCVCRVLLGIHFIRDVSAGALLGILSGVIGLLITL